jgi:hypothetical protein
MRGDPRVVTHLLVATSRVPADTAMAMTSARSVSALLTARCRSLVQRAEIRVDRSLRVAKAAIGLFSERVIPFDGSHR